MPKRGVLVLLCLLFGLTFASASGRPPVVAQASEVDLTLVLAIDCSFSVDANEFRLQMQGSGQAFMRPEVKKAISQGTQRPHRGHCDPVVGRNQPDGDRALDRHRRTDAMPTVWVPCSRKCRRSLAEGGTSIIMAIQYSANLLADAPPSRPPGNRHFLGRAQQYRPAGRFRCATRSSTRASPSMRLTILNEWPTLDNYFEDYVVGGAG